MAAVFLAPLYLAGCILFARSLSHIFSTAFPSFHRRSVSILAAGIWGLGMLSPLFSLLPAGFPGGPVLRRLGGLWLGFLLYAILSACVCALVYAAGRSRCRCRRQFLRRLSLAGAAACAAAMALGYVQFAQVQTTFYACPIAKSCPTGERLRVALVSDLHLGASTGCDHLQKVVEQVNAAQPDLVCLAGDIFDNSYDTLDDPARVGRLMGSFRSRLGTYACLGNHDVAETTLAGFTFPSSSPPRADERMLDLLDDAGVHVLNDEAVCVNDAFYLVGRKDAKKPADGVPRAPVGELLQGLDPTLPILVLDHQPRDLEEEAAAGADAVLSGHTHGGQLFPANLLMPLVWENPYGYRLINGMHSIVTSGAGAWGPPMRLGVGAEVAVVDFIFSDPGAQAAA